MNEAGKITRPGVKSGSPNRQARHNGAVFYSPTAKMDLLRAQLAARGLPFEGMSWKLLILEWKYDLAVLAINFSGWMREVDQRFRRLNSTAD